LGDVRVEVIPTGIDDLLFRPQSKSECRARLDLPQDKKLILFIATRGFANERKGGGLLSKALHILYDMQAEESPDVVILGRKQGKSDLHEKYTIHSKAFNDDISLSQLYAACDVLVAPSKADTLPLTVLQAMACGTPCVAFDTGGMADVIEHLENGYLAPAFDVDAYAKGIDYVLGDEERHQQLSFQSIRKIKSGFTVENEAKQYIRLYDELLSGREESRGG